MLVQNLKLDQDLHEVEIANLALRTLDNYGFEVGVVGHCLLLLEYSNIGLFQRLVVVDWDVEFNLHSDDVTYFVEFCFKSFLVVHKIAS